MAKRKAGQLMPDFNSWISDLNLSSPYLLEKKVDEICKGIDDRLNPKNAVEYIKIMQSHLLLEVWSQIRIFIMEQYQKNDYFNNAQLMKLNKNQIAAHKRNKSGPMRYCYSGCITIRSAKTRIQIAPSSYLLLLWTNSKNPMTINLKKDESKQSDYESKASSLNTANGTKFPPHILVQVNEAKMSKNKFETMWNVTLSLNAKSYELIKEKRRKYGKESDLNVVPIKNLIYLQRDYDAVQSVDKMPLSIYMMGKEHLIERKSKSKKTLLDSIKNDGLYKKYFNRHLNNSQYLALKQSLMQQLTLIHGPPGTGKTKYVLLPILKCSYLALKLQFDAMNRKNVSNSVKRAKGGTKILQAINKAWKEPRIGVFAGSNQAIDEIILTILASSKLYADLPIARMGNSYNMDANVANNKTININKWIDYYLAYKWNKETKKEVYDSKNKLKQRMNGIQSKLKQIEKELLRAIGSNSNETIRSDDKLWDKVKTLYNKSRPLQLELDCLQKVETVRYPNQAQRKLLPLLMNSCKVLFSTANYIGRCTIGANNRILKIARFDFSVFDECCQMRETETLIALQHCAKTVLIGDPQQLQATILYHGKYRSLLLNSLFNRIEKYIEPMMLTEQYRMNEEIAAFPSKQFYDKKLLNAINVKKGERKKSFHSDASALFKPYLFFNVIGCEQKRANSLLNLEEIECIQNLIHNFSKNEAYLKEIRNIGIITPYLAHKNLIDAKLVATKKYLLENYRINIECVTVDEFQGSERDIIIFSCVRSNKAKNIGFLNDVSRLNVAITRAKYALWIIGNADCLKSADLTWKALVEDVMTRNLLITL